VTAGKAGVSSAEQHDDTSSVTSIGSHLVPVPETEVVVETAKGLETMNEVGHVPKLPPACLESGYGVLACADSRIPNPLL
jgi:hypothetical protein